MSVPKNFKQIVVDVVDGALEAKMPYIKRLIDTSIDDKVPKIVEKVLGEKIKYLPTKKEFYKKMDELLGEIKGAREEFAAVTYRSKTYDQRLEKLEKIHPKSRHTFA